MNIYSYVIRHRNGWGTGCGPAPTHCAQCSQPLPERAPGHTGGTGYGCGPKEAVSNPEFPLPPLKPGEYVARSKALCYPCCGKNDTADMIRTGRAVLYLTPRTDGPDPKLPPLETPHWYASNWPGTLRLGVQRMTRSKSGGGFGAQRTDVWFTGPDGKQWHGVNRGASQLLRCRRVKS